MNTLKYLLFATMLAFTGCADDGDPGPKGDKGDTGEQGLTGETGTPNVIYSEWFALNTASNKFTLYENPTTNRLIYEIRTPAITEAIVDEGLVLMFFRYDDLTYPFPVLDYINIDMELYAFGISKILISFYEEGFKATEASVQIVEDERLFRYIIIPGGNPASSARALVLIDYTDYEAVKSYYNIPD